MKTVVTLNPKHIFDADGSDVKNPELAVNSSFPDHDVEIHVAGHNIHINGDDLILAVKKVMMKY